MVVIALKYFLVVCEVDKSVISINVDFLALCLTKIN